MVNNRAEVQNAVQQLLRLAQSAITKLVLTLPVEDVYGLTTWYAVNERVRLLLQDVIELSSKEHENES